MFIIWYLSGISFLSVFLIFLDYHKKRNIHKAVFYVISFFALLIIFKFILLPIFSFYCALIIPPALFIYLLIVRL
jgi:hypothetical protein